MTNIESGGKQTPTSPEPPGDVVEGYREWVDRMFESAVSARFGFRDRLVDLVNQALIESHTERERYLDDTARAAMQGVLADDGAYLRKRPEELARDVYDLAEAMWKERERRIAASGKPELR